MFDFKYKDIDFAHKIDVKLKPSDDYAKHFHQFYEIFYFISGDVSYTVEKEVKKLENDNIIIISPGAHHSCEINPNVPYERYVLKLPSSMIPNHLKIEFTNKSAFLNGTPSLKKTLEKMDSFFELYKNNEDEYILFTSLIMIFLVECCNAKNAPITQLQQQHIAIRMIDYIQENIRSQIDLNSLSKFFNYSKIYLSVEFKKYMGLSIMQYIRNKKIYAAKEMIQNGHKPTHVAEYFGFDEYSTFYRAYLSIIGVPPSKLN